MRHARLATILTAIGAAVGLGACMSAYLETVGGAPQAVVTRIYLTDFGLAWQSALESLKSHRFDVSNRDSGFIQTRWYDNTNEKNFVDSFGSADTYLKAQVRFRVTVAKGFFNGKPSVKISVEKEQLVQYDALEGWRPVVTDPIEETTLLYRISRIIAIKSKLKDIEEQATKKQMENLQF